MTIFGHKNLLITQDKFGQSCTIFSKPQVCQSFWRRRIQRTRLFHSLVKSGYNHRLCEL